MIYKIYTSRYEKHCSIFYHKLYFFVNAGCRIQNTYQPFFIQITKMQSKKSANIEYRHIVNPQLNGHKLITSPSAKCLGILLDETLSGKPNSRYL